MSTLAEVQTLAAAQALVRDAVVPEETNGIEALLVGGQKRFDIHRRNFEISLVNALTGKFPASAWLVGPSFVTEAARKYVHRHPPIAPCIAEYGEGFPQFLAECPGAERAPYLADFACLEWHIGHISIAVEETAVPPDRLAAFPAKSLPGLKLSLQSGLRYLEASWPVDRLMEFYLTDTAPDRLELEPEGVWIELRGQRGEFSMNRLPHAEFAFRKHLSEQNSIGDAIDCACEKDATFDARQALAAILADGMITAVEPGLKEAES